ncbi:MAG: hypothetical protein FWG75_11165 [Cystobacterineae bacterium]|nr:hypothetical protein [Cystobacterineae bacterium]
MYRRGSQVLLLSVLLSMSLGGCASLGKKTADVQRNAAMGENGCSIEDKRLLEIANLTQRFERISRAAHQKYEDETETSADFDENSYIEYNQSTDEGGVLHVSIEAKSSDDSYCCPLYRYAATIAPDGSKIISYDANADGSIDVKIEEKSGQRVLLQTYLMDTDGDGVFDERISNTFNFEKNENQRVVEKLIWEKTLEKTEALKAPFPPEMKIVPKLKEYSLAARKRLGKKPAKKIRVAMGENGCISDDKRLLEIAKLTQRFEKIFEGVQQEYEKRGDRKYLHIEYEPESRGASTAKNLYGGALRDVWKMFDDAAKNQRVEPEKPTTYDESESYNRYAQWTDENGVIYVEISGDTLDEPYYSYAAQIHSDGTKVILYGANVDENMEMRIEERLGQRVLLQTYLMDTDGDGVFDERISNTFDFEKNENQRVVEKLIWEKTLEKTEALKAPFPPEMKNVPETKENLGANFAKRRF